MKECTECKHCNERGYYTGKWYCTNPKISVFRVPDVIGDCFEPRTKGTAGQQNANRERYIQNVMQRFMRVR